MSDHIHRIHTRSGVVDIAYCACGWELGRRDRKKFKPPKTDHGKELAKLWSTRPVAND